MVLPPWPRTPLTPTNASQHINIAFSFILKVDKSLNQRALRSPLRLGALPVLVGRDGASHPASGVGWRRALAWARCIPALPEHHSPSQTLIHQQLAANNYPSEATLTSHGSPRSTQELTGNEQAGWAEMGEPVAPPGPQLPGKEDPQL